MLYKVKKLGDKDRLVCLKPSGLSEQRVLEKTMEQWLVDNPSAVLPEDEQRVLVISQETPFENVTDILAVDAQGRLVVIEVKRGQSPREVIAQVLEYASEVAQWNYDVLNKTASHYFKRRKLDYASLLDAFNDVFKTEPGSFRDSEFNKSQRIFIVAENIEEGIARTARWLLKHGIFVTCLEYTCYVTGDQEERERALDFQEIVRPGDVIAPPPTEVKAVERLPEGLRRVYLDLKARVSKFGADAESAATTNNLVFRAKRNFAEIQWRNKEDCLVFWVRPEGFSIGQGEEATVEGLTISRVPDSHGWTLSHSFKVREGTNLDAVEKLLRQSYDAVHKA